MTDQRELYVDSLSEALEDAARALGGYQKAAAAIWPAENPLERGKHLRACLDDERREKLAPGEIAALCRAAATAGCLTPLSWLAETCGCEAPRPADPRHLRAELGDEMARAATRLQHLMDRYERITAAVVPMSREGSR